MKDIIMLRSLLADIHGLRNAAVVAVNERDVTTLRNKLTAMKRKIATIEAVLDAAIHA
jgi:hypothetical protein